MSEQLSGSEQVLPAEGVLASEYVLPADAPRAGASKVKGGLWGAAGLV